MTLEAHLLAQITEDVLIAAEFLDDEGEPRPVEDWMFSASSLGVGENPAVPKRPYVVYNELDDTEHMEVRESSDCRTRFFQWWVYDEQGDYTKIERVLHLIKRRVKQLGSFKTADGVVCMQSDWLGTSGRIPSDGYASSTKFGSTQHVVSR